jgi:hypothetical protein
MISICPFIANWVRGLSSQKQRCAKLTKLGVFLALRKGLAHDDCCTVFRLAPLLRDRIPDRALEPRPQLCQDLLVRRADGGRGSS